MAALAKLYRTTVSESLPFLPVRRTAAEDDLRFFEGCLFVTTEIWMAEHSQDEAPAGYVAFRPDFIEHLFIRPAHQGQGLGLRLLEKAKAQASELSLWTFQQNVRARRFYERHGFLVVVETDGADNEEQIPDVLYRWRREAS